MPDRRPLGHPDLKVLLADVAAHLDWTTTGDPVAATRTRLAGHVRPARPERPWWRMPRPAAWAALAVAVVIGLVLVLPGPREAVADWFGLGGVEVRQEPTTVPVTIAPSLDLGQATTLEQAAAMVDFELFAPSSIGPPDAVFTDVIDGRQVVSLAYGPREGLPETAETGLGLLVTEFDATFGRFIGKVVASSQAERLVIDAQPALWIQGSHQLFVENDRGQVDNVEPRLAANTLVVQRGDTTVRMEGSFDRSTAVGLAQSLVPVG